MQLCYSARGTALPLQEPFCPISSGSSSSWKVNSHDQWTAHTWCAKRVPGMPWQDLPTVFMRQTAPHKLLKVIDSLDERLGSASVIAW